MRTAKDIYIKINQAQVGDLIHLRSGVTATITSLRLLEQNHKTCHWDEDGIELWEVGVIDHDAVWANGKAHYTDRPFVSKITTDILIVRTQNA